MLADHSVVLLDRNFDLSVMLQHCWLYKPLVQVRFARLCVPAAFHARRSFQLAKGPAVDARCGRWVSGIELDAGRALCGEDGVKAGHQLLTEQGVL
jgi:hypothetical protein